MIWALAQIKPVKGDILANLRLHIDYIERAANIGAGLILFPELSLTGYEPEQAERLAMLPDDHRLEIFQALSERSGMVIGVGMPLRSPDAVRIAQVFYRPQSHCAIYAKRHLHPDELPYFVPGKNFFLFSLDQRMVAPAICYEISVAGHALEAHSRGADIYLASVAKTREGMQSAYQRLEKMATETGMTVLLVNSVGPSDNFFASGQSAVWNNTGELLGSLGEEEGILIWDSALSQAYALPSVAR